MAAAREHETRLRVLLAVRDRNGVRSDWHVDMAAPVTVGAVADAVGLVGVPLELDGEPVDRLDDALDAGFVDGAMLAFGAGRDARAHAGAGVVELRHTAGRAAGGRTPLPVGQHEVGRGDDGAAFLLTVHGDGTVLVAPGTASGVTIGGAALDGAARDRPVPLLDRTVTVGQDVFEVVDPNASPAPAPEPQDPVRLVAPPLLADGTAGRTARRRAQRRRAAEQAEARRVADRQLATLRRDATLRRRAAHLDPAGIAARATVADPEGWTPAPPGDDDMTVAVGTGSLPWRPPVEGLDHPLFTDLAAGHGQLHGVPVTADVRSGLGLTGPRGATTAVARHVLLDLALRLAPSRLELAIVADPDRLADWDWCKWLPHLATDRVCTTAECVAAMLERWTAHRRGGATARLLVVDRDVALPGAVTGTTVGVAGLVLAGEPAALPNDLATVVRVDRGDQATTVVRTAGSDAGRTSTAVAPRGMSQGLAERCARALSAWPRPGTDGDTGTPSVRARLTELLPLPAVSRHDVAIAWRGTRGAPSTPVGRTTSGTCWLDLDADGPHLVVAGGPRREREELLRTLVCGFACDRSPLDLELVLVDASGDGGLAPLAALPHAVGVLGPATERDEQVLADRLLADLAVELGRRSAGRVDPNLPPHAPRRLVVVGDLAALVEQRADVADELADLAGPAGRVGVHLLVASDRVDVVSERLRAHLDARLVLGLEDPDEAVQLVGVPEPAVRPVEAGRAWARFGEAERAMDVRTASTDEPIVPSQRPDGVLPFVLAPLGASTGRHASTARADTVLPDVRRDLDRLVETIVEAGRLTDRTWTDHSGDDHPSTDHPSTDHVRTDHVRTDRTLVEHR